MSYSDNFIILPKKKDAHKSSKSGSCSCVFFGVFVPWLFSYQRYQLHECTTYSIVVSLFTNSWIGRRQCYLMYHSHYFRQITGLFETTKIRLLAIWPTSHQTLTPLNALVCIMIECSRVQTGLARSIVCMSIQEYQGSGHVGEVSSGSLVTIHPSQLGAPTCQRLLLLLPTMSD